MPSPKSTHCKVDTSQHTFTHCQFDTFRILEIQLDDDGNYRQVSGWVEFQVGFPSHLELFICKNFFLERKIQRGCRSRSLPPALIVPAPRRRYPSEVLDPHHSPVLYSIISIIIVNLQHANFHCVITRNLWQATLVIFCHQHHLQVLYWDGVGRDNLRLMEKIFKRRRGRRGRPRRQSPFIPEMPSRYRLVGCQQDYLCH